MAVVAFGLAVAYAALRWRPFRVEVHGDSMVPTLESGDWAIAVRTPVRVGAVAVVEHPGRPGFELVKRVVAGPGDAVPDRTVLGAAEYWVEGDAAGSSSDSRAFGPVRGAGVRGTVVYVWWPAARRGRVV